MNFFFFKSLNYFYLITIALLTFVSFFFFPKKNQTKLNFTLSYCETIADDPYNPDIKTKGINFLKLIDKSSTNFLGSVFASFAAFSTF